MSLSWTEIRARAGAFARDWANESRERAEAQTFWNEFFAIFGMSRRRLATFEAPVSGLRGQQRGSIDLFWKGVLVVEHKSRGARLDTAFNQAIDYFEGLRDEDLPRFILVSDFARFRLFDLDASVGHEFALADLPANIRRFAFILGQTTRPVREQEPANRTAADLMAGLHDALAADGFAGHDLEILLVRLLFCFFADDTGIIEPRDHLHSYLERTREDGSDLGRTLAEVFDVLNTPREQRQHALDEDLAILPYVNGNLFGDRTRIPRFSPSLRRLLLDASAYNWSAINPVIFGSLFQSVGHVQERRRAQGMHYTSEANILKLIGPLFLDDLHARYTAAQHSATELRALLADIRRLTFLDPACGCGNFLVVAYRELRLLELRCYERLRELGASIQQAFEGRGIDVDAFHGIEIEDFPSQIARTALWLVDHQMNLQLSELLGEALLRLPLITSANIVHGNALGLDWNAIIPRTRLRYILGNPPFIGKKARSAEQVADMQRVCGSIRGGGELDYVCAWYAKAAEYIAGTPIKAAFVSTNSIAQGEQVGILWRHLLARNISIRFAHRTFRWSNEARNNAHVYCVIIGFAEGPPPRGARLPLYDYETPDAEASVVVGATHINPYLIDFPGDTLLAERRRPVCAVPPIVFGNMPNDNSKEQKSIGGDGNLLLDEIERERLLARDPEAHTFVRPFLSNVEWLNGQHRYCLWLTDASPAQIRALPSVCERVERVRAYRAVSTREETRRLADSPHLFGEIRQPTTRYVLVPRHSSEHRRYIPMGFADPAEIAADSCCVIPDARLYHLGVLQSDMHMAWVRHVCGRIKSDFRYSNTIVYNNFPWPDADGGRQDAIAAAAQAVLDARAPFLDNGQDSLASIYDPNAMPRALVETHRALSREVDRAYAPRRSFPTDRARMEFLLARYSPLAAPQAELPGAEASPPRRRRSAS